MPLQCYFNAIQSWKFYTNYMYVDAYANIVSAATKNNEHWLGTQQLETENLSSILNLFHSAFLSFKWGFLRNYTRQNWFFLFLSVFFFFFCLLTNQLEYEVENHEALLKKAKSVHNAEMNIFSFSGYFVILYWESATNFLLFFLLFFFFVALLHKWQTMIEREVHFDFP